MLMPGATVDKVAHLIQRTSVPTTALPAGRADAPTLVREPFHRDGWGSIELFTAEVMPRYAAI
jgi:hypothetical protein